MTRITLLVLLASIVVASGCVQNSSTDLNPDFQLDYEESDFNRSGGEMYQEVMSKSANVSDYRVEADNRMAMNLPIISVSVNMTSEGVYQENSSEINSSGTLEFNIAGKSNSTDFTMQVENSGNSTMITRQLRSNNSTTAVERYSDERLGISLEALENIEVENASILGTSQLNGEESILLELEANSTSLMKNSENIFEVHSPIQESGEGGQGMEQIGSFDQSKAYLWIEEDEFTPRKFAYYGSAGNGAVQVRSVTQYNSR